MKQQGNKCIALCIALALTGEASPNDGQPVPMPRPLVPVNNYQWFMIGVAITYTICLVVRSRRRKARRNANKQI